MEKKIAKNTIIVPLKIPYGLFEYTFKCVKTALTCIRILFTISLKFKVRYIIFQLSWQSEPLLK